MRYDIVFHPAWWHRHTGICFDRRFWDDPVYRIEADQVMRRTLYEKFGEFGLGEASPKPRPLLGSDMLACGFLHSEMLGCDTVYTENDAPCPRCMELSLEQAAQFPYCSIDNSEVFQRVQQQIDWLLGRYGHLESYINHMGVQNVAFDLCGMELYMGYLGDEEEQSAVRHILDVACDIVLQVGQRLAVYDGCLSAGVTNIVRHVCPRAFVTSNCTVEMISQETYKTFLLSHDQRLAEAFPVFGIHHCGQTAEHVVGGYAKVPHLQFFEAGAFSDLAAVRDALPADTRINMRISPTRLSAASPDEIRAELAAYREILPGERLSVSCAGIGDTVTDEQVCIFLDACREFFS